jgi:hypothetical protein
MIPTRSAQKITVVFRQNRATLGAQLIHLRHGYVSDEGVFVDEVRPVGREQREVNDQQRTKVSQA